MSRRIDLTEKLSFDEHPVIVVKGKEIEINDDAMNVLKLMGLSESGIVSADSVHGMASLLFTEEGKENLDSLCLNMKDYMTVIETAMDLATGEDGDEEQAPQTASTI